MKQPHDRLWLVEYYTSAATPASRHSALDLTANAACRWNSIARASLKGTIARDAIAYAIVTNVL